MTEIKTSAPVKDEPHPFQPAPEVPVVFARAGAEVQGANDADATAPQHLSSAKCALCGATRDVQIHVDGKAEAETDSPKWG